MSFDAIVAREENGKCAAGVEAIDFSDLPPAPILVRIDHSALNYKDALAVCGNRNKILKSLPGVPGIDLAGTVVESADPQLPAGTKILATGWGLGERHWGGFSRYARVKPEWLVPLPDRVDSRRAMILGTAGLTAMLCVESLEQAGLTPASGEILVTGAMGGVGSLAIMLLAALGYSAVASSGRSQHSSQLEAIGAKRVIPRAELDREPRPLDKEIWAGAIDTVGSRTLATVLSQTRYGGTVSACGLAGGFDLPTTVMPFILRNVRLQGIDSVYLPESRRAALWNRLAALLPAQHLDMIAQDATLADVPELAARMIDGQIRGRTVIAMDPAQ